MEVRPRRVEHYVVATDGSCPFQKWVLAVRGQPIHAKILQRLDRVEQGNFGKCKSVGGGVYELIFDFGPGYRLYFGQDRDSVVILCAGDKSTQEGDIRTAKRYWKDYNA